MYHDVDVSVLMIYAPSPCDISEMLWVQHFQREVRSIRQRDLRVHLKGIRTKNTRAVRDLHIYGEEPLGFTSRSTAYATQLFPRRAQRIQVTTMTNDTLTYLLFYTSNRSDKLIIFRKTTFISWYFLRVINSNKIFYIEKVKGAFFFHLYFKHAYAWLYRLYRAVY